MNIKQLNNDISNILEQVKLISAEDEDLQIGNAYTVDTKEELLQFLQDNQLIPADSVTLIQDDCEITIYLDDEDEYSIVMYDNSGIDSPILELHELHLDDVNKFLNKD